MNNSDTISAKSSVFNIFGWAFGLLLVAIGIANMILVHPVPGIVYLLVSLIYLPPTNALLKEKTGLSIPMLVKVALGIVIIMFTLGVSDLGDMIDGLSRKPKQVGTAAPHRAQQALG
jgi:hypothetical protein